MKPKPIIFVISCRRHEDSGINDAIRQTWLGEWGHLVDIQFVVGKSFGEPWTRLEKPHPDITIVHALDEYKDLSRKVYEADKIALEAGYTHVFKCDTDSYVHVPRLLASNFDRAEYIGNFSPGDFAAGGSGYWLGPQALKKFISTQYHQFHSNEDANVATALRQPPNPIRGTHDPRYILWHERLVSEHVGPQVNNDFITAHLAKAVCGDYDWTDMQRLHQKAL